jgi:predicted nucleotidyltransferase
MKMIHPLDDILGRRSNVAVLRYLIRSPLETTGRELAREIGMDHKTCLGALRDLECENIVRIRRVGRACFVQMSSVFPLIRDLLKPMFEWEANLPDQMARDIAKTAGPLAASIILFGSTAKKTDTWKSDVDLMMLARRAADLPALDERGDQVGDVLYANYGRSCIPLTLDLKTFRSRLAEKDYFIEEIVRTGRVLHGLRMEDLAHEPTKDRSRKRPPK